MIKIFKFIFLLLVSYGLVAIINAYDSKITLDFYDYKIQISLFFIGFISIILILSSYMIIRIIANLLSIPFFIYAKYSENSANKEIELIMNSYAEILMTNNFDKAKLEGKLKDSKYKQHIKFILSITDNNMEHKIIYLTKLSQVKEFGFYSYAKLTQIMLEYKNYEQALVYANNALSYDRNNIDINCFLLQIYVKLSIWDKFDEVFSFFYKQDEPNIKKQAPLISQYLTIGAKSISDNRKIKTLLETALRLDSSNIEAIELFCEINAATNNIEENKLILDEVFLENPSFQIFLLYKNYTNISGEKLYDRLANLVDPKLYPDLFWSIECYTKYKPEISN